MIWMMDSFAVQTFVNNDDYVLGYSVTLLSDGFNPPIPIGVMARDTPLDDPLPDPRLGISALTRGAQPRT